MASSLGRLERVLVTDCNSMHCSFGHPGFCSLQCLTHCLEHWPVFAAICVGAAACMHVLPIATKLVLVLQVGDPTVVSVEQGNEALSWCKPCGKQLQSQVVFAAFDEC
jgi:hypothetical protein